MVSLEFKNDILVYHVEFRIQKPRYVALNAMGVWI